MRILLLLAAAGIAACGGPSQQSALDRLEPCTSDDGPTDAFCGRYEVFEDREAASGRKLSLKVVVLPALSADAATDPLFLLAGGPGQGAAQLARPLSGALERWRRNRDIVLVDQRGTGDSNPLECEPFEEDDPPPVDFVIPEEKIHECLESYDADVRLYTTPIAMDDLDEVRDWLGYDQINLIGMSYGTRAALVYLRRHEEHVRSVIIDGVAPPNMSLPLYFPRDTQQALDHVIEYCQDDANCAERFPNLRETVEGVLADLRADPRTIEVRHWLTGERFSLPISDTLAALTLSGALYQPATSSLIPLVFEEAQKGDYEPLLALSSGPVPGGMSQGMFYSVTCSEDYPRYSREEIDRESEGRFLGLAAYRYRWGPCEHWPRGTLPEGYYDPVESDKPVLILSGELDPVTPPIWGESVAKTLTSSRHFTAPGLGHGVSFQGCGVRLIDQFLEAGSVEDLDGSCLEDVPRPPFFVSPSGPVPESEEEDAE